MIKKLALQALPIILVCTMVAIVAVSGQVGCASAGDRVYEKVPPPVLARLDLAENPIPGEKAIVRLHIENHFHDGQVEVQLKIPQQLRLSDSAKSAINESMALNDSKQYEIPIRFPSEGQYRLHARITLSTPQGNRVSTGASITIGQVDSMASPQPVLEATSADGRRLRIHRVRPTEQNGTTKP